MISPLTFIDCNTSIPESLQSAITALASSASKPLAKTLAATTASLATSPSGIWVCAPLIESLRQFWALKDWLAVGECDQGPSPFPSSPTFLY